MPALVQICVVIATIGLLAIALWTVRVMTRAVNRAADDISQITLAVREPAARIDLATHEAQTLMGSLRDCVPPVRRVVDRFEAVGQRTADHSSSVLEELELPVFIATAVARGARSGANHLLKRPMYRITRRHPTIYGGYDHE